MSVGYLHAPKIQANSIQANSIKDSRGRVIILTKKPMRIASGSLASDEIVFELLKRSGELGRLAAVSTLADDKNYSNISTQISQIKGRLGTEAESTLALKPDLIILASFNRPELVNRLSSTGIKTFVLGNFSSIQDISDNILKIGRLIHTEKSAKKLSSELMDKVKRAKNSSRATPKIISWSPGGTVMAKGTTFDSIANTIGAQNLASKIGLSGWPKISAESVLFLKPEFIVVSGESAQKSKVLKLLQSTAGWKELKAVKEGRIILIPQRFITSTSHFVMKAIDSLSDELTKTGVIGKSNMINKTKKN